MLYRKFKRNLNFFRIHVLYLFVFLPLFISVFILADYHHLQYIHSPHRLCYFLRSQRQKPCLIHRLSLQLYICDCRLWPCNHRPLWHNCLPAGNSLYPTMHWKPRRCLLGHGLCPPPLFREEVRTHHRGRD